jgi:serine/threonine-protein kinase
MASDGRDEGAPSAAKRRIGTWIRGKYRLDSILGEGGMAVVYAATHRNKKRFALKMLRGESASEDAIRRFLREGYVANTVDHPGVVAVLDDDVAEDGNTFLVMDLLHGESVDQLWERWGRKLSPELVLTIAYQLSDVLAAAHEKNVVHRDIKPANIFWTHDQKVKVLDFGIARLHEARDGEWSTHTGTTPGTPAFMAPEQARGKNRQVGPLTDIWAVGATMFTLLSGDHAHFGESAQEMLMNCATLPARSLSSVAPEVPAPVVRIVDRAMQFAPADRWPSAATMRDAIFDVHQELFGTELIRPSRIPAFEDRSDPSGRRAPTKGFGSTTVEAVTEAVATLSRRQTTPIVLVVLTLALALGGISWYLRVRNRAVVTAASSPTVSSAPPPAVSTVSAPSQTAPPASAEPERAPPQVQTPSTTKPTVRSVKPAPRAPRPPSSSTRPTDRPPATPSDWDRQ